MNDFIEIMKDEIRITELLIDAYSKNMTGNLKGTLTYRLKRNQLHYYLLTSANHNGQKKRKQTYLGGPGNPKVDKYKQNRFYKESIKVLQGNLKALKKSEKTYQDYSPEYIQRKLPDSYKDLPERCHTDQIYEQLLKSVEEQYEKNPKDFPRLSNITVTDAQVRSKGEAIIYNLLISHKIPFRYEAQLKLTNFDGSVFSTYPDFTIDTSSRKNIYWEHAGLLERDNYYESFCNKIRLYHHNGITLGDNLIVTADKAGGAINTHSIDQIIKYLILPKVKTFN